MLALERGGEPFLALRNDDDQLSLHLLGRESRALTVGRRRENDICLVWDSEVSGLHAQLECLGGEWTIVDDGLSTNGTFVNGERISGRERLQHGDAIRMGQTTISFGAGESSRMQSTLRTAERPLLQLTDTQKRVLVALCRPYRDGSSFATPASNQEIAQEVFLSVDAVKMHLRGLFSRLGLSDLPQNQKRARLAECALQLGLVSRRDLG